MSRVTVWSGPVNAAQNGDLRWPDSSAVYVPCTGDGSGGTPRCSDPLTVAKVANACKGNDAWGAAFSAGGMAWERALSSLPDLKGLYLADGTYSAWEPGGKVPSLALAEERMRFIVKAAEGNAVALFTASSSPNGTAPSGSQTLEAMAENIGGAVGSLFWTRDLARPFTIAGKSVTARSWVAGNATLLDFGSSFTHTELVTVVARALWPMFTGAEQQPSTTPGGPSATAPRSPWGWIAGVVGTGLAALGAGALYSAHAKKKRQPK